MKKILALVLLGALLTGGAAVYAAYRGRASPEASTVPAVTSTAAPPAA